jgi:hypothetical protein
MITTVMPQAPMRRRPIAVARCIDGIVKIRRYWRRIEILTSVKAAL